MKIERKLKKTFQAEGNRLLNQKKDKILTACSEYLPEQAEELTNKSKTHMLRQCILIAPTVAIVCLLIAIPLFTGTRQHPDNEPAGSGERPSASAVPDTAATESESEPELDSGFFVKPGSESLPADTKDGPDKLDPGFSVDPPR